MSNSNTERPLLEIYQEMIERVREEHQQLALVMHELARLIAFNPATADDYYQALKLLGGKMAWLQGKEVEIEHFIEKAKTNPEPAADEIRSGFDDFMAGR